MRRSPHLGTSAAAIATADALVLASGAAARTGVGRTVTLRVTTNGVVTVTPGQRTCPDTCVETGGEDLFVFIPEPKKHYRVVLERYRNEDRTDRLALFETPTFRG